MDLGFLDDAAKVGGGAVGGGAVSAFFGYLTSKNRVPSIAQDAVNRAVKTALDSTTREIDRLNDELEKIKKAHRDEMEECLERSQKCEEEHRKLREEVERWMKAAGVAQYTELRRVAETPKRAG